jgi:hypothetical protein
MIFSKDLSIQNMTRAFIEDERKYRQIPHETETIPHFLNWKDVKGRPGTASLINNTRRAVKHLGLQITIEHEWMTLKNSEAELKTKSPAKIGRFLTQRIIRSALAQKVTSHEVKGASFPTLRKNDCSNKFLRNTYTKRSDSFFRFAVAARSDCLATPANIQRWYNLDEECCRRCDHNQRPTLAHILNSCPTNFRSMTDRHNRVVRCVKNALEKHIAEDLIGAINENTSIPIDNLSDETRNLRPDIWFIRREGNREILEILEFSCPFGHIERNENTLKRTFEFKMNKYLPLANEYIANTRRMARVHPIIVSSQGAVYNDSMTCLKSILRCSDKEMAKLGTWLSEQAILGSFKLWIEYQRTNEHHHNEQEEAATEILLANQENIEDLENEDEEEEEEEKDETDVKSIHQKSRTTLTGDSEIAEATESDETFEADQVAETQRNDETEGTET